MTPARLGRPLPFADASAVERRAWRSARKPQPRLAACRWGALYQQSLRLRRLRFLLRTRPTPRGSTSAHLLPSSLPVFVSDSSPLALAEVSRRIKGWRRHRSKRDPRAAHPRSRAALGGAGNAVRVARPARRGLGGRLHLRAGPHLVLPSFQRLLLPDEKRLQRAGLDPG